MQRFLRDMLQKHLFNKKKDSHLQINDQKWNAS